MIRDIPLRNKPLCIYKDRPNEKGSATILIGDARGSLLEIMLPRKIPTVRNVVESPISSICKHNGVLFFATWDGCMCKESYDGNNDANNDGNKDGNNDGNKDGNKENTSENARTSEDQMNKKLNCTKIGTNMVKCFIIHASKIYASVDMNLVVLDLDLRILAKVESKYKIYCMEVRRDTGSDRTDDGHADDGTLVLGMACGHIGEYRNNRLEIRKSSQEGNILSIKGGTSGGTGGKLMEREKVLYEGAEWIRFVENANLFSSGRRVIRNGSVLYEHEDDVVGLVETENEIVSIGLDYKCKIYREEMEISDEDLLMQELNSE